MYKLAIVILNWNGKNFLEKFLPFLVSSIPDYASVIIADNASTDDSIQFLNEKYPTIRVIKNDRNFGFAEGYNVALKQIDAEYYVLLNSDIEVSPGWVEPVIAMMDADKNLAACQPKILSYHDRNMFEYAGAAGGFIDKLGYPFCRGRVFQSLEEDRGQYDQNVEVFWATGACMFVRAEDYHRLGGLDNDFFAHMEEIDFCWRLKNNGYKVMVCGQSKVYHIGGGTLPKNNSRKTYLNFRNNFFLLFKNISKKRMFGVFLARLFLDGFAAFKFLFEGHPKDFFAVLRAHFAFYFAIPSLIKKRKRNVLRRVDMIYRRSIVMQHYLKGVKRFSELNTKDFS